MVVVALVAVVAGFVVWRQSSAPDLSPVSTVAQGPFLCDGVPQKGAELILGGPVEVTWNSGEWGSDSSSLHCTLERGGGLIAVYEESIYRIPVRDPEMFLDGFRGRDEFDADAPQGRGFVFVDGPGVAEWLCGERHTRVVVSGIAPGRDKMADAAAYLTSMLPWACGDAEPPEADAQP